MEFPCHSKSPLLSGVRSLTAPAGVPSSDLAFIPSQVFYTISIISASHPWQTLALFTNAPALVLPSTWEPHASPSPLKTRMVLWMAVANESWTKRTHGTSGLWALRAHTWLNIVFSLPQCLERLCQDGAPSPWVPGCPHRVQPPSRLTMNTSGSQEIQLGCDKSFRVIIQN